MSKKAVKCKKCGAEIIWIQTIGGRSMPCNAEQTYYIEKLGAKDRIVTPNGEVLACILLDAEKDDLSEATGYGYVPHWATCPAAEKFKKRGK